jgi:metallophosphoesterase superfamily enzyme
MIEADEKSTAVPVGDGVLLDGRLAIWHPQSRWLALADVHYGYEMSRRAGGGLWPMWGMATIEQRCAALVDDYQPQRIILGGDIVDSGAACGEALAWIESLRANGTEVICVAGNHDRGAIRRKLDFVDDFACDGFFFHHGHQSPKVPEAMIEVCGHWHPSWSAGDGAGTRLRLPTLVQEHSKHHQRWILPAFSPWAGGGKWRSPKGCEVKQWACSPQRVFVVEG